MTSKTITLEQPPSTHVWLRIQVPTPQETVELKKLMEQSQKSQAAELLILQQMKREATSAAEEIASALKAIRIDEAPPASSSVERIWGNTRTFLEQHLDDQEKNRASLETRVLETEKKTKALEQKTKELQDQLP